MWSLFKYVNLFWLLSSTYMWPVANINALVILTMVNLLLVVSFQFLPLKWKLDLKTGLVAAAIIGISMWYAYVDDVYRGFNTLLEYLPVLILIQLPYALMKDLLRFCTKFYAILLIPSLLLYFATLFVQLPSLGNFVYGSYPPFQNYFFFIKTTYDTGFLVRFNAFFMEPGHQSILSTFLIFANRFRFKEFKLLIVLVVSVIFSFSLAGYILLFLGYIFMKLDSWIKAIFIASIAAVGVTIAINFNNGENALNDLIISRLEYDEEKGIKGNNRAVSNTDFEFQQALKKGRVMKGTKEWVNMELVQGAGFKRYILNYGIIGIILILCLYIALIPSKPDYRYTISYLLLLAMCFMQRSYPMWYSWLFPYVMGIYLAKYEKMSCEDSSSAVNGLPET